MIVIKRSWLQAPELPPLPLPRLQTPRLRTRRKTCPGCVQRTHNVASMIFIMFHWSLCKTGIQSPINALRGERNLLVHLCASCILGNVSSKATSRPRQRCPNPSLSAGSNVHSKEHSDLFLYSLQNLDPPMDPEDAPWPSGFEPPAAPQVRYAVLQDRTILARVKLATGPRSPVLISQQHGMQRCCWFCACSPAGSTSAPGLDSKARSTFAIHPQCEALRPLVATMKAFTAACIWWVGHAGSDSYTLTLHQSHGALCSTCCTGEWHRRGACGAGGVRVFVPGGRPLAQRLCSSWCAVTEVCEVSVVRFCTASSHVVK